MKKAALMPICILTAVLLAACGKSPPPTAAPESGVESPPYFEEYETPAQPEKPPTVEENPGIIENLPSGELEESESQPEYEPPPEPEASEPEVRPLAEEEQSAAALEYVQAPQIDSEKIERELLRLINSERAAAGSDVLSVEDGMEFAARIRADEALERFSHTRPNGTPYNTVFDEAGFSYAGKWHGENLASLRFEYGAITEEDAALEMFLGLKSSPGHYGNMTNAKFLHAGIGVSARIENGAVSLVSAQLFASL